MIDSMKKLSLIVFSDDAARVMDTLAWLSCAEIEKTVVRDDEALLRSVDVSEKKAETERALASLRFAIPYLSPYRKDKTGIFKGTRPPLRKGDLENMPASAKLALQAALRAQAIEETLAGLSEEERRLSERSAALAPWQDLKLPLDFEGTAKVCAVFGTFPTGDAVRAFSSAVQDEAVFCHIVHEDAAAVYCLILFMRSEEKAISLLLSGAGFARVCFSAGTGTAAEAVSVVSERLASASRERAALEDEKRVLAASCADMETAYDILNTRLGILEEREKTTATAHTVLISGWLPAGEEARLDTALSEYACSYVLAAPEPHEDVPVRLSHSAFADPFEALIGLYSYPKYGSFDPTFIMGIFFSVFFGLMTADVGYGFLITIGSFLMIRLMRPRLGMRRFLKMFAVCGAFSMIAGVLFNGWFGDLPTQFAENILGISDFGGMWHLVDPISDPITFFVIALAAGAIHLITGMVIKMVMLIRRGDVISAVFDVGSWLVIFAGIGLYAVLGTAGGIAALVGVLMIVFTHGRRQKNIVMKFFSGLLGLYDIVNYMSDLLSYSRVLALGLSSAVIASVFNVLATLGGASAISFILFPMMFLLGHALNIALGVLGAFVHSSRLQYLEFFGKFYEDGGRPFAPMAPRLKYTDISSEDAS